MERLKEAGILPTSDQSLLLPPDESSGGGEQHHQNTTFNHNVVLKEEQLNVDSCATVSFMDRALALSSQQVHKRAPTNRLLKKEAAPRNNIGL